MDQRVRRAAAPSRRTLLAGLTVLVSAGAACAAPRQELTVYKSPTYGCCTAWVDHACKAGSGVKVEDVEDLAPVKARLGVPAALASCGSPIMEWPHGVTQPYVVMAFDRQGRTRVFACHG